MPLEVGDVPLSQYVHGVFYNILPTTPAQGLVEGNIELWGNHAEADLVA
jgi:hypothetical protein